jgi:membrane associated rhomboid family serine protease
MSFRSRTRAGIFYVPGFPKGVKWLLISNVAVFLLGFFAQLVRLDRPLGIFALIPVEVVKDFFVWQLATYLFLHGGFGHIIWNMLALWMFGADLERAWGTRRFIQFYFFCGIGAGVCVVVANYLLPWGNPLIPTIGSSGAIFGILLAYAMMYPDRTILWGFLIPIQVLFGYIFMKSPRIQFDLAGPVRRQYHDWKLRRAKKKFQVYLRKQGSGRGPTLH